MLRPAPLNTNTHTNTRQDEDMHININLGQHVSKTTINLGQHVEDGRSLRKSAPKELEARLKNYKFKSKNATATSPQEQWMGHRPPRYRLAASPVNAGSRMMGVPLELPKSPAAALGGLTMPDNNSKGAGLSRSQSVPVLKRSAQRDLTKIDASEIGVPHRVDVPNYMKVPDRCRPPDSADQNEKSLFRRRTQVATKDCMYRANACRRAGRTKAEANAYFSMGINYDNVGNFKDACRCYLQVIQTLDGIVEDVLVTCLAYNSIAISLYNAGPSHWDQAIHYNQLHLKSSAAEGKFSAFINLGLIFTAKNDAERAATCHKDALRCALKIKSVQKQAIAIGNLGLSGYLHHDYNTAEACMERHLQLSKTLDDVKNQVRATKLLGEIANRRQDYTKATGYFRKSMQLAHKMNDTQSAAAAKIQLGVSLARSNMDDHMRHAAQLGFNRPVSY